MSHNLQFYIDGAWVDPVVPNTLDVIDPSNEDAFARISMGSKADVDKAVAAARRAFAARGDAEHYVSERQREEREILERTHDEEEEIYEIFEQYSVDRASAAPVLAALKRNPNDWVNFMMRFELGLEKPAANRAHRSALTIAASYIVGGIIPLLPYILVEHNLTALKLSVVITLIALAIFGALKGRFVGSSWLRSAVQTTLIGGIAAAVAYALASFLNSAHP